MKKKKIGIDARLYSKTGVGVYIRNLIHYLYKLSPQNVQFLVYLIQEDYDKIDLPDGLFSKQLADHKWHSFAEQTSYLQQLLADKLDLMHFTYFSYPILYKRPFIATIHDTIMLEHKTGRASTKSNLHYQLKHIAFQQVFSRQVKNSKQIITPTETIKQRLIQKFGDKYGWKIQPITEGVSHELKAAKPSDRLKDRYPSEFYIYVGNFYPHKNVDRLIEVFTTSPQSIPLLLVGPDDHFLRKIKKRISQLKAQASVLICDDASIEDLAYLYSRARALIHPSLDEGFCLPLLEAAYFNLSVIASDIPVFHEILGDSYLSFNPLEPDSIRLALDTFEKSPLHTDYSQILRKRTFEVMTKNILKIYQSLL